MTTSTLFVMGVLELVTHKKTMIMSAMFIITILEHAASHSHRGGFRACNTKKGLG
jgi:hypothetical protein